MQALGYPLRMTDRIPEITEARNIELGLGLQVVLASSFLLSFLSFTSWSMIYYWLGVSVKEAQETCNNMHNFCHHRLNLVIYCILNSVLWMSSHLLDFRHALNLN